MKAIPFYISIFMIMLGLLIILVFSHYQITQDKIGTMEEAYKIKQRQLSTDFEIINVAHEDNLTITILNTGSEKLLPNKTRVFMPLLRESNTIIDPDFNLINPLLFDPGERAHIIIEEEIEFDKEKNVTIVTENSVRKSISFKKEIVKLNIETAKNSNSETEQKELINSSNNVYSEIQIETDSEAFLWINYSLDSFYRSSNQSGNVTIIVEEEITEEITETKEYFLTGDSGTGEGILRSLSNETGDTISTWTGTETSQSILFVSEAYEEDATILPQNINSTIWCYASGTQGGTQLRIRSYTIYECEDSECSTSSVIVSSGNIQQSCYFTTPTQVDLPQAVLETDYEISEGNYIGYELEYTTNRDNIHLILSYNSETYPSNLVFDEKKEVTYINETEKEVELEEGYNVLIKDKFSIQDAIINIEHYFDNSTNVEAYIEYKEKNGWVTIGQLSNFETKGIDNFYLNKEAENYRIRYYSNNINTITSFVDNFEIIANITSWKDIS